MHRSLYRIWSICLMAYLVCVPLSAYATVFTDYETSTGETAYHANPTINSRRTDHFIMRFGNQPREGYMQEHVVQGQLQFLEHVYDHWQSLGLRELGGIGTTKYKDVIKPHATWDWDSSGTAVGFMEGGSNMIPGAHIPANALNYMSGNGCTPHEFGHGWQNQHLDSTTGGLPACQPQGFTESLANWVMSLYLASYPNAWPAVGATYGHAMVGYNCMSIFAYFMEASGYGPAFINKLIFDPNLNSGANYAGDDIVAKAIRCDTSGAVDHAGAIRDGLGMMNAKMLDMDFWNHRVDRAYAYDKDTTWSFYQWTRIPMVKQPGVTGFYRPEWLCTPQQASNSYIPLTITAGGSPRVVTCEFRPVSDAVRGTVFRACFVAFNANKEPRYSKVWNAGEKSFALADDENSVYLAVFAIPAAWNTGYMSNDYIADNVAMMPYRVKFTGATPKDYQWADPGVAHHAHSNGGGYVADTATVDASAYVGPNARVLGTAKVYGNARIDDYAVVDSSATIGRLGQSDSPVVCGHAYVTGTAQVYGHAKVRDYAWIWGSAKAYDNAVVMAHTMLSGGSAFGNAVLNQCPMRDTGLSFSGTYSGSTIRGGDNSGGGTYTQGVYAKWENSFTGDAGYQYLGYNFEKKSAIFAMDQYGLNHSFLMGEPQVVSDTVNSVVTNVLSLNGSSQYVELKSEAVDFGDLSIMTWVKWTGSANDQRIFSAGDGSAKYVYLTPKDTSTGKLRLVISNGTTTQYLDGAAALTANTWTHVAVTFSGNTAVLYVNGTAVDTDAAFTVDPDMLNAPLMDNANYIGRGNAGNYFQGSIDEFRVYTKALTSTEVGTAKNAVTAGAAPAADTTAPTPNAATWLVNPVASSDGSITMTANTGTDAGGNGVLYYFRCVNDSTHDSGWISESKFTDFKCAAGTLYTYAVKMKDKLGNTGTESTQQSATASAADTAAPTPNPPTFSSAPKGDSTTSIAMTATKATDADETVLYKFSRVGGTATSGWSSSRTWIDTGLTSGSSYSYTLQIKDSHGNTTSTTTSAAAVARDDTAPAFDTLRRLQWDTEPYVRLDKTIRMSVASQAETAVDYYFECVENTSVNSGWISAKEWVTPAMADGTWTFRVKLRDRSPQLNQTAWSNTAQTKVLTTNCYHDYLLTQLAGLADSTLVRFTGKVTAVNIGSYVVSTTDGLTSITVVPHSYNYKTDATLLNQNVTVKGHLWTYDGSPKQVTYAYVLGSPATGKLEFENADPIGASTMEAAPYYDKNASFLEAVNGWWTVGDAVEFPNVAASTELTICYGFGGTGRMSLYINGTHARDISFPSTGGNNSYGYKIETGLSIPAGATLRFQSDSGDTAPCLDFAIVGPTYSVSGSVTDASNGNAPVSGAKVYFSPVTGAIAKSVYAGTTDASGNYTVRLPAGTWYAAAALNAEVQIKSSGEQSLTTGPDRTGINFSINWDPSRSGKIEAETGKCLGIASAVADPNASGGMVISQTYEIGAGVEFSNIAAASQMTVSYGYSNGTYSVYVNGVHATDMNLPWHPGTYGETTISITIPNHATVKFLHDTGDRDTQFDYIIVGTAPTNYTITASAGTGGSISPSGAVTVSPGANQAFAITPNTGYGISNVTVDGVSQGSINAYTFSNVTANHTISATFTSLGRNVPGSDHLLFSAVTDTFPSSGSTGSWATFWPTGGTLTMMGSPIVETIGGDKWEQNLNADGDGYLFGSEYTSSIPCSGASIIMALRPMPCTTGHDWDWRSAVDVFYDRLVLGVRNWDGKISVRRNGSLDASTGSIPNGQLTVLSMVVQPTGQYKVYANGTQMMDVTTTSDMTSLVPGVEVFKHYINVGRSNPDGWSTFNGNIGDVFVYKTALSDADRQTLEADLISKFGIQAYTITASAGAGGSISPTGAVSVNAGTSQAFTIAANTGYVISQVAVDGVNQGAITSYPFNNVTANHTISATFASALPTPVACYQFENNVLDSVGTYNGTAYNSPTYVTGKIGSYAIQFNGTNQYVSISRMISTDFSIAFWVKTTQTSPTGSNWYNGKGLVDGEVGGVQNDFGISYLNSKVAFGVGNTDTTIQSTSTINSGNWVYVVCTRNSTTGEMKIYINGTLETTRATGPTGAKTAPSTLHIGNLQTNLNYFAGSIDQVKIFSSVLSASDISALYNGGVGTLSVEPPDDSGWDIYPAE